MRYDHEGFVSAKDGTKLFYEESGRHKDALILLDGLGCDGYAWKYLVAHYARTYRVVHVHYRGHGRSGNPIDPERIGIPALAHDIASVLAGLHIESAILCGHSMGVQVALEFYRHYPHRVRALLFLCGTDGRVTASFQGTEILERVLPRIIEAAQRHPDLVRGLWGWLPWTLAFRLAKVSRQIDALAIRAEDFRQYVDHLTAMDPQLYLDMLRLAGEHSASDVLSQIHVPTLVIAAERDTFTPPARAADMAKHIPGVVHRLIPNASHAAPIEQPLLIRDYIDLFLQEALREQDAATDLR